MNNATGSGAEATGGAIFRRNVGGIDRILRLAGGAVLLALGLIGFSRGYARALEMSLLGLFIMVMAGIGFCPLYLPFGISTARRRQSGKAGE